MLVLLCRTRRTVGELAEDLGLTNNAVRAQLQRMQRDGLVRPAGSRRGVRKPHVDYELTNKGRQLFPRAYEPVLAKLLDGLGERLSPQSLRHVFAGVLRGLVRDRVGEVGKGDPRRRLSAIVGKLGGSDAGIQLEAGRDSSLVRPCICPLASVTASHPELCAWFAGAIGEVLGTQVKEECERGDSPRCGFRVAHRRA